MLLEVALTDDGSKQETSSGRARQVRTRTGVLPWRQKDHEDRQKADDWFKRAMAGVKKLQWGDLEIHSIVIGGQ